MKQNILSLIVLLTSISSLAEVKLFWTDSSDSVQAVVYKALYELKQADDASQFPRGAIKRGNGAELIVEDENSKLSCNSKSFGMTPVQSYSCQIQSE